MKLTDTYYYLRLSLLHGSHDTYPQRITRQLSEARATARKLHKLTGCTVEVVRHTDAYGPYLSPADEVVFSIAA